MHLERNMQADDQYEIIRLVEEFNKKGYEQKFNGNPDMVFSVLFGLSMAQKELNLQGIES